MFGYQLDSEQFLLRRICMCFADLILSEMCSRNSQKRKCRAGEFSDNENDFYCGVVQAWSGTPAILEEFSSFFAYFISRENVRCVS
jgi:hypothetical protein